MADNSKIIPLLFLNFPGKRFFYSTIDISVTGIDLGPLYNYHDSIGVPFLPMLMSSPEVKLSFDPLNPSLSINSVGLQVHNVDNLQDYEYHYPLESIEGIFLKYDLVNQRTVFRMIGKMTEITFDKEMMSFTLQDKSKSVFINQPANVLSEDTFQTIHTLGPFVEDPLDIFGLLVDIDPGPDGVVSTYSFPGVAMTNDDRLRSVCVFIEHPALYNADDDYWVGALVSIIEDPLEVGEAVERTGYDPSTGAFVTDSPYYDPSAPHLSSWLSSFGGDYQSPLYSKFCLGASAYVLKDDEGNNASFSPATNPPRGRIYFDTTAQDLALLGGSWSDPTDLNRLMPHYQDPGRDGAALLPTATPLAWRYENRTAGAIAMGSIAQRHVIRIWRRGLPENGNSVGMAFPIAYGNIKKGPAIHAMGGKAIGDEGGAGNDVYIFCGHQMASRIRINVYTALATSLLHNTIQFKEVVVWHSLDEFVDKEIRDSNPYIRNKNEYEVSNNPIPRLSDSVYDRATRSYTTIGEKEPNLLFFNAGEDVGHRYPPGIVVTNRQISIVDNSGVPGKRDQYSGIKLRGEKYWEDNSTTRIDPTFPTPVSTVIHNTGDPRHWIRNGLGGSSVYASFNGEPDFDDGLITGVPAQSIPTAHYDGSDPVKEIKNPAGMITNPADIIAHFLIKYTDFNITKENIDWPSFRKARGMLFNWEFSSLLTDITNGADVISRWLTQSRCMFYFEDGKFYLRYIDLSTDRKVSFLFKNSLIKRGTFKINRHGVGELYSRFVIKYKKYYAEGTWLDTIEYDETNNRACAIAKANYGAADAFEYECEDIRSEKIARFLADYFVELYTKPRWKVSFRSYITEEVTNIKRGDLVVLQHSDLPNPARLLNLDAQTVPKMFFLVTDILVGQETYGFELLQLFPASTMR